jgi:triosephosphate isomerase (TIM)
MALFADDRCRIMLVLADETLRPSINIKKENARVNSMRPIIIINFKTYPEATGKHAVELARLCEQLGREHLYDMRVAVQPTDIAAVAEAVNIPVYAQHIDPFDAGKHTGAISAQAIKAAGAAGSLLNHSERMLSTQELQQAAAQLQKEKLQVIIGAESLHRLEELGRAVQPTLFFIEPPELIGGEVSVSVARPDIVGSAVHATKQQLLIGAGIREFNDLHIAIEAGAKGVILSSHIVTAKDHRKALLKLLTARGR